MLRDVTRGAVGTGEKLEARDMRRRLLRCGLCGAGTDVDVGASADGCADVDKDAEVEVGASGRDARRVSDSELGVFRVVLNAFEWLLS